MKNKKAKHLLGFFFVAGSTEISNSLKRDLLEIGALYDYIEDYKKYAEIGDSCGVNTIN